MEHANYTDFYISYQGHPRFNQYDLVEDDVIRVIIQKYEMILFTNKGDVLFEPNLGVGLEYLLHETRLSAENIEGDIRAQIADYIPEIDNFSYQLSVEIFDDPNKFQEYMVINFTLAGYDVYAMVQ